MAGIKRVIGIGPSSKLFPKPKVWKRAPTSADKQYKSGQIVIDTVLFDAWFLCGYSAGVPQWINAGGGTFTASSLTITPGPTHLTGKFTVVAGTEKVSIGADAANHDIDIGSATSSSKLTVQWGSSGATFAGADSGTLTFGSLTQTGSLTFGQSTSANTVRIGAGINTGNQTVEISNRDAAANSTINALSGTATAGTQTFNIFGAPSTSTGQAFNLMNAAGSGTRVFTLAGSSALATTIGIGDGLLGNTITLGNGINSVAQTVSIASGASAADSIVNILAGNTTAGTQTLNIATGTGSGTAKIVNIGNADGNTDMAFFSPRESSAGVAHTLNAYKGRITATGVTTASAADETITITNSICGITSGITIGICVVGAEDAQMTVQKVRPGNGSFTVLLTNNGAAQLASNLIITFEIFN